MTTLESSAAPTPPSSALPALALFSLHGTVALVTGAARGIGQACAIALAEAGADVVCVLRRSKGEGDVDHRVAVHPTKVDGSKEGGNKPSDEEVNKVEETNAEEVSAKEKTQDTIAALGVRAYVVYADLEDMADVKSVWGRALGLLEKEKGVVEGGEAGKPRIHILVNCAGVQRRHPSVAFPEADWDTVLDVNLKACFLLAQAAGNHFLSFNESNGGAYGRGGKIINFCSLLSYQGGFTVPAYAASKGALMQLTKALSNEWAHANVQVNGVSPGYVRTDMCVFLSKFNLLYVFGGFVLVLYTFFVDVGCWGVDGYVDTGTDKHANANGLDWSWYPRPRINGNETKTGRALDLGLDLGLGLDLDLDRQIRTGYG